MTELPTSFGKYYLIEKVATGGMAEIYLAKLIGPGGFEKQLIIKQIHPELSGQRAFVDLFVAEAKTLVSLGHGNIVPVYELGMVDDVYFIAMEYIDGPTLRELCKALARTESALSPAIAAFICAETLKGLDYAHRKGVVHRDVSPRNVMLSRDGEVKLLDFGIAVHDGYTQRSQIPIGSYPYMSPEQVSGQSLTAQSDLFSTGVLLWEMLTGSELFARPSAEETLRAVTEAAIEPPSTCGSDSPPALDEICLRALARDPGQRYASAAQFLAGLNRYLYSLDDLVTLAALARTVARSCPPVVRRPELPETSTAALPQGRQRRSHSAPESVSTEHTKPMAGRDQSRPGTAKLGRHDTVPSGRHGTVKLERSGTAPSERHSTVKLERSDTVPSERSGTVEMALTVAPPELPDQHARATDKPRTSTRSNRRHPRRASTVRTFATHAEFERVLARANPLDPVDAIVDDPIAAEPVAQPAAKVDDPVETPASDRPANHGDPGDDPGSRGGPMRSHPRRASTSRDVSAIAEAEISASAAALSESGLSTRWRTVALLVAVLLIGVGVGAVIAQRAGSGAGSDPASVTAPNAGRNDPVAVPDPERGQVPGHRATPSSRDGRVIDAAPADGDRTTRAGERPHGADTSDALSGRPDRRAGRSQKKARSVRAASRRGARRNAKRNGRLKVGANPWAEVYVDGQKLGRAPQIWSVPAGSHQVDVVFPVTGRQQTRSFEVDIKAGKTTSLGVIDFSDE